MGQFFCRRDAHGRDRWWLDVTGKGGRQRLVPATDEMMAELSRYRRAHRLPALPVDGEATPLVLPVGHAQRPLTRAALDLIVKTVFRQAADRLRAQGDAGAEQARVLEQASAHWLRHSAGSHMADGRLDLRLVRDNLGPCVADHDEPVSARGRRPAAPRDRGEAPDGLVTRRQTNRTLFKETACLPARGLRRPATPVHIVEGQAPRRRSTLPPQATSEAFFQRQPPSSQTLLHRIPC